MFEFQNGEYYICLNYLVKLIEYNTNSSFQTGRLICLLVALSYVLSKSFYVYRLTVKFNQNIQKGLQINEYIGSIDRALTLAPHVYLPLYNQI